MNPARRVHFFSLKCVDAAVVELALEPVVLFLFV
jgi:hypothetical protein